MSEQGELERLRIENEQLKTLLATPQHRFIESIAVPIRAIKRMFGQTPAHESEPVVAAASVSELPPSSSKALAEEPTAPFPAASVPLPVDHQAVSRPVLYDLESLLATYGHQSVLAIGASETELAFLRQRFSSVKVRHDLKLKSFPMTFPMILVLGRVPSDQVPAVAHDLYAIAEDTLIVAATGVQREAIERPLIQAGFRKSSVESNSEWFLDRDKEEAGFVGVYAKIPETILSVHSLERLLQERDLHMDMFRETGHRSDAHLVRYHWAAKKLAGCSFVVDAACGLGYGSAILAAALPEAKVLGFDISGEAVEYANALYGSERVAFATSDVRALTSLESGSVDGFVSFETLEHVPDPEKIMAEVARVLRPNGVFVGSVPNLWCDDSGNDPSPYHFQVFDLDKLMDVVQPPLLVDEVVGEWAGQPGLPRKMESFGLGVGRSVHPEWWLIAARRPGS